jgi:hypothetical protein
LLQSKKIQEHCILLQIPYRLSFAGDKTVVLAAIANNGLLLEHASPDLRNDAEVVTASISHNGFVLRYASQRLRADPWIVVYAGKN